MLKKVFFYPALFMLCWVYSVKFNDIDFDLMARLAVGKMVFQTGHVLPYDVFSYTVTKPWIDHEWLSGLIFYVLEHKYGDAGLLMLKILLFFTIMLLISHTIRFKNPESENQSYAHKNILFYFLLVITLFFVACHTVRCQLITFTMFTLWLYTLERVRRGENRLLWIMPATTLIWANMHGGFVAGLGLLGMYGVGEFLNKKPWQKYFLTLIPTSLVTLINPYGFKYLQYIYMATTMKRVNITEWAKTDLLDSWGIWFNLKMVILVAIAGIIFNLVKHRKNLWEIDKVKYIVTGVTLFLALNHIKHQGFFIIAVAAYFYHDFYGIFKWLGGIITKRTGEIGMKTLIILDLIKNALVYAVIIIGGGLLIRFTPLLITIPANKYPVGTIEYVRQNHLKGNLTTVFHWGSYAAWKLYPDNLIALDGRYEEVYPSKIFMEVTNLIMNFSLPSRNVYWDDAIKKYNTDILICGKERKQKGVYDKLKKSKDWKLLFEDQVSALFVKKDYPLGKNQFKYDIVEATLDKYKTNLDFLEE